MVEVAQHHCHDFDRPRIHCFRSAAALDDAIAAWTAARSADGTSPSEALATLYVRVYEHQGYQGASLAISSSTTNLGSVGWNDRITSFISIGLAGRFYEHINYAGDVYPFTAYQAVSNIGDAWNDRISSVRVP